MMVGLNNVSTRIFQKHLKALSQHSQFDKICLTFDDGFEDTYTNAFPILNIFNFKLKIFPVTNYIGQFSNWDINFKNNKSKHANKDQLIELSNKGWEIGTHGHQHISNSKLSIKELEFDIRTSKDKLEDIVNSEIVSYTPPFGVVHTNLLEVLEQIGIKTLFLHHNSKKQLLSKETNVDIIFRNNMYNIDTNKSISRKLNDSKIEILKENIIHFCSKATIGAKEFV